MKKKKEIEEKVLSYVEKHHMLAAGDHVLCGLSGGADSVCLLYLLLAMKKHIPITITAVHVNHRLREEADLMVETHFIRTIIFDFSGTDWMDSSGIGVILGRYKNMKLSGGHVYAVHLNERMKKIFAMSGMEHLIGEE